MNPLDLQAAGEKADPGLHASQRQRLTMLGPDVVRWMSSASTYLLGYLGCWDTLGGLNWGGFQNIWFSSQPSPLPFAFQAYEADSVAPSEASVQRVLCVIAAFPKAASSEGPSSSEPPVDECTKLASAAVKWLRKWVEVLSVLTACGQSDARGLCWAQSRSM